MCNRYGLKAPISEIVRALASVSVPPADPFASAMDGELQSFAILTSALWLDAANCHVQQPVMLEPADNAAWLNPALPFEQLVAPPMAHGYLEISERPGL